MTKEWLNSEEMTEFLKEKIKQNPKFQEKIKEEESLAAEYFRPKFYQIISSNFGFEGDEKCEQVVNELIECLKNPEGKL